MRALFLTSIFQSLLMVSIFSGVGAQRIKDFKDLDKVNVFKKKKMAMEYITHN